MAKVLIQDLAEQMSSAFGYNTAEAQIFVRTFFETIVRGLEKDKYVRLKGLGTFKMIEVDDRESINVNTGERFMIQGHSKVSFQPDNSLKDLINKPFSHFETVVLNDSLLEEELLEVDKKFENMPDIVESELADESEETYQPEPETVVETPGIVETAPVLETVQETPAQEVEAIEPQSQEQPVEQEEEVPLPDTSSVQSSPVVEEISVPDEPVVSTPLVQPHQPENDSEPVVCRSHTHTYLWMALCVVFLLTGYVMGHFNLFTPQVVKQKVVVRDTVFVPKVVHDTIRIESTTSATQEEVKTTTRQPASVQSETKPKPQPVSHPTRMTGGAYEIVGTKETYTLQKGETLRIIAERYYGNRNLASYIIAHNNLSDPNLVTVGMVIKIPELRPKNSK